MSTNGLPHDQPELEDEQPMLDAEEAEEEIINNDEDAHMDSDPEGEDDTREEIELRNDSIAHFDQHKDSIFCIGEHPTRPHIVATGGGDDIGYIWSTEVTPSSNAQAGERSSIKPIAKIEGHTDSINAVAFLKPYGTYFVSAGLDGQLRVYFDASQEHDGSKWQFVTSTQEVEEINFIAPCPHPYYPHSFAIGASDGSVWVYTIDPIDPKNPLQIMQAFYLHTGPCTAGAWTPDGKLLCTVSEDGSFYTWDVFGDAAATGLVSPQGGQNHVVGLTADDERFRVDGGLYSVNVSPGGAFAAVGGAGGNIRIIGLPRLSAVTPSNPSGLVEDKSGGVKKGSSKQTYGPKGTAPESSMGQAGQILASLQTQSDSVETISFSQPPLTLMATGSVDGSIVLYDARHQFMVRRHITEAHDGEAVIKVEFAVGNTDQNWVLTSCGNDGVVRRWDTRGSAGGAAPTASNQGILQQWKGHQGGGEGGGILDFVQPEGRIVTAGDDGVSLVFKA